jgi:predicted ArsR family transcriptional regulator
LANTNCWKPQAGRETSMSNATITGCTSTRILQLLQEGPALAGELAAELQLPSNRVSSYLHQLAKTGRVRRAPSTAPTSAHRSSGACRRCP